MYNHSGTSTQSKGSDHQIYLARLNCSVLQFNLTLPGYAICRLAIRLLLLSLGRFAVTLRAAVGLVELRLGRVLGCMLCRTPNDFTTQLRVRRHHAMEAD